MEEKADITIEDILYQGKRKNRKIDKHIIMKAYLYAKEKIAGGVYNYRPGLRRYCDVYFPHQIFNIYAFCFSYYMRSNAFA